MGMYTEIVVKLQFEKVEVGENNFNILSYLFNINSGIEESDLKLPEHEFFKSNRWRSVGFCSSFYHHPNNVNDWCNPTFGKQQDIDSTIYVFNRADLKNYDSEIEKFFNWYSTLSTNESTGDFIGYSLYEEDNIPTSYKK